jgi:integrase
MRQHGETGKSVAPALPWVGASGVARRILTDRFILSSSSKPATGRTDHVDALVPGLALRVSAGGHRSYVLIARYPSKPKNPTRRTLGRAGELTLEQARAKARGWLALIRRGIDPKVEEARQRAALQRSQVNTFAHVAEEFLTRHAAMLAHAVQARRIIEAEFVKAWGQRPATDILPEEAASAIRAVVKRGAPAQAHAAYEWLRRLYTWAIGTGEFGVTASPVAALRPTDLIGKKVIRDRILTDDELRAVWQAASGTADVESLKRARSREQGREKDQSVGYPYGPLFRLLILTGQREREVAEMRWREVDFSKKLWTIPASRMKGGRTHEVPLAPEALALLRSLPRFTAGDAVFTTTDGTKPVNGFSKAKGRLDKFSGVTDWVLHDLRRTTRTHFSALPVQDNVREAVIAHARPGLHKVYDQHTYEAEKRECLRLWEHRLRGILRPPSVGTVVALKRRGATSASRG